MKTASIIFLMIFTVFYMPIIKADNKTPPKDLVTVRKVDLNKYTGLWYEIARIPNRFQKQCLLNTTARYELKEDGKIEVLNRCIKEDGEADEIKGIAKVADPETNAKLKVSFVRFLGISLFWADYWIIGLADDYHWAVVGSPSRKYGWILARDPILEEETLSHIYQGLAEQGYDSTKFVLGQHNISTDMQTGTNTGE
jgi:apolipoprotein D and lipocalin family protein